MTRKLVECLECGNKLKVVNAMHLKKHNLTIPIYLFKYKGAYIIAPFDCEECGKQNTKARSPRAKYCDPCSVEVKRRQVLAAVKRNQAKKRNENKNHIINRVREANREYGLKYPIDGRGDGTRIDKTHSSWDFIPSVMNIRGTFPEKDLDVGKDGRVKGWKKLKEQIAKQKRKYQ